MVEVIKDSNWEAVQSSSLAVLDFSATWCGPCRMVAPVLDKLSEELSGKMGFFNADVDDNQELAQKFAVQNIPTLVILKNGEEVDRQIGFQPEPAMRAWLEKQLG